MATFVGAIPFFQDETAGSSDDNHHQLQDSILQLHLFIGFQVFCTNTHAAGGVGYPLPKTSAHASRPAIQVHNLIRETVQISSVHWLTMEQL